MTIKEKFLIDLLTKDILQLAINIDQLTSMTCDFFFIGVTNSLTVSVRKIPLTVTEEPYYAGSVWTDDSVCKTDEALKKLEGIRNDLERIAKEAYFEERMQQIPSSTL